MIRVKLITVEMEMTKEVCMWNLWYVQTLYPKFDGVMDDSMLAILTYRLYLDRNEKDHTKAINRKLRALEVICRDKRVGVTVTKGEALSKYLQDYPLLMKLNQTLESRDD